MDIMVMEVMHGVSPTQNDVFFWRDGERWYRGRKGLEDRLLDLSPHVEAEALKNLSDTQKQARELSRVHVD